MLSSSLIQLLLLATSSRLGIASHIPGEQVVFTPHTKDSSLAVDHVVDTAILAALDMYADPVDALVSVQPERAAELAEPRLLHVSGERQPEWMTEGDKLRLRRRGKKFMDITDHQDFYAQNVDAKAGKAYLPPLTHQPLIKPLFSRISTDRMHDVLKHMTSYYNRYFGGVTGHESALWLHDHIAKIIDKAPFGTHISLEFFTHAFPQPSIIARFEPKVRNFSLPLTILGAHQDSANYLFPLLPAPGADDDCSGTVSILEAFRVLAESGFTPKNGPVEFHWYAAEEGGLLGSQAIARYKKEQGAHIGAMMEFDMTAFIARNATESIGFIITQADAALTNWTLNLSREYISIPSEVYELGPNAGSDYMSYTQLNYPAAFASEGNPLANGGFPGDFDPYVHGIKDTMDVNDETGYFSLDHMARFSELAVAFTIEQAGWDNRWR
ncbi:peptidase family M28 [Xylogone sp. PMI_703]|nr:peptidase family M28 [Xylogone sp. PMI_703]